MQKNKKITTLIALFIITFIFVSPALAEDALMININTATLEELVKLDRIGPKYAQRIIDYREGVAPFSTPEDIMNVKGIGIRTYEANKDIISVE